MGENAQNFNMTKLQIPPYMYIAIAYIFNRYLKDVWYVSAPMLLWIKVRIYIVAMVTKQILKDIFIFTPRKGPFAPYLKNTSWNPRSNNEKELFSLEVSRLKGPFEARPVIFSGHLICNSQNFYQSSCILKDNSNILNGCYGNS